MPDVPDAIIAGTRSTSSAPKRSRTMSEELQDQSLFRRWRAGDEDAARQIHERYVDQLLALAKRRISQRLARRVDAEDILQSVFRTFFNRARQGQFHVEDPDDLCKLLVRITLHKTLRQVAFHSAAKRDMKHEEGSGHETERDRLLEVMDREPSPEEASTFLDELESILEQQRPQDREIIDLRMQGFSNVEIAEKLGISDRKIRRLMERLRGQAEQEGVLPPEEK
jgi:RNA polymerase sigma-70 factor (ECF subfamily)